MKRFFFGIGRALGAAGRATVALVGICGVVAALANYTMTQGNGTTFGSIVVSSVHYAQQLICDSVTPANCATVKPASTASVATDLSLVTQLNPDSPGIIALGQTTKSASVPVTFASDQYVDPCMNPLIAKSSVPINITSATTTQLVAISGSTSIYVCHFDMTISEVTTTANTLQFEYGTSTNCTGTNKLTGLYGAGGITAGDPISVSAGFGGTLFSVPASNGLCALTAIGATGSFQGLLTYAQL